MIKEQLIRIASEEAICSSLRLSKIAAGIQHLHEKTGSKTGQCHIDSICVAGILPHSAEIPKMALIYAKANNVFYKGEKLPDWERLALLRRAKPKKNDLIYSQPIDCSGNPFSALLSKVDLSSKLDDTKTNSPVDFILASHDSLAGAELYISAGMQLQAQLEVASLSLLEQLAKQDEDVAGIIQRWKALIP